MKQVIEHVHGFPLPVKTHCLSPSPLHTYVISNTILWPLCTEAYIPISGGDFVALVSFMKLLVWIPLCGDTILLVRLLQPWNSRLKASYYLYGLSADPICHYLSSGSELPKTVYNAYQPLSNHMI